MSEMNEEVLDEAMKPSTDENASETKEDENVTSTEEAAETAEAAETEASDADSEDSDKKKSFFKLVFRTIIRKLSHLLLQKLPQQNR